jgi:hypothetical protein
MSGAPFEVEDMTRALSRRVSILVAFADALGLAITCGGRVQPLWVSVEARRWHRENPGRA